jgi:hypothetical protein
MADLRLIAVAGCAVVLVATEAAAQALRTPGGSIEATTDHRRRGLSWSEGKAAIDAIATLPVAERLTIEARATTLRDTPRHGGADLGIDVKGSYRLLDGGGWQLSAGTTGHFFAGAGGMNYVELDGVAGYAIGPAQIDALISYAPAQSAIGGDNLYLGARASAGIPMTPFTVLAHVGRSTGNVDDPVRAARLRPGGDYTDWGVRVEQVIGKLAIGLRYSGTDIDQRAPVASPFADLRNAGDRVTAHVALFL